MREAVSGRDMKQTQGSSESGYIATVGGQENEDQSGFRGSEQMAFSYSRAGCSGWKELPQAGHFVPF